MSITLESFNSTYFNPLPPYGGRQVRSHFLDSFRRISIHSLRMEGDSILPGDSQAMNHFNPLPPYGGRQPGKPVYTLIITISIHSLRMEGDYPV